MKVEKSDRIQDIFWMYNPLDFTGGLDVRSERKKQKSWSLGSTPGLTVVTFTGMSKTETCLKQEYQELCFTFVGFEMPIRWPRRDVK